MFSSTSDSAISTRSFQNETLPRKRLSSDKKLLTDITNLTEPRPKRQCGSRAQELIGHLAKKSAPRGDPVKGNQARYEIESENDDDSSSTLRSIKRSGAHIFKDGGNRLDEYIYTCTTYEVQKAFALRRQ